MDVLVLSPHTDDSELGAGGTISRLRREGHDVYYVTFSSCNGSLPPEERGTLTKEFEAVMDLVDPVEYFLFDYEVRKLNDSRQEILEDIVTIRNEIEPDLVIGPSLPDHHQDHTVVANEMVRAFKTNASIITYELPWNHVTFESELFYPLEPRDIERKLEQLSMYRSQREEKDRVYFREDFTKGLAAVRGVQCDSKYAEAFSVVRWLQ
ncbi:PIG-L family deacetylase [Natronorubrum sp. JWXQ-INN-674]|uniref:PIG-L family deacetylase n=1 Tax=Natronorubrum halalkaliphilum TaxID=2691917 RepID=A0A6B0VQB2_9EURY|nr:PIG-L family deacetylase [Natronorubrum halalkaliphilum]MXV63353.1 PIG-L family deacetylase [Natronorubrum halalkaliphilum]